MGELLGGAFVILALGGLLVFIVRGPAGFRGLFGGLLTRRREGWAGRVPADVLLIVTAVMFAIDLGVSAGGAGAGLAYLLIMGAAIGTALVPNIANLVLGVLGLMWAIPKMVAEDGIDVVAPIVLISLLAAALAGILRRG